MDTVARPHRASLRAKIRPAELAASRKTAPASSSFEPARRRPSVVPIAAPEARPFEARLATYDAAAWEELVHRAADAGSPELPELCNYTNLIDRMPLKLRDQLLAEIGKRYPTAQKNEPDKPRSTVFQHFPKRKLDGLIKALLKPEERFQSELAAGKTPVQAMQAYFDLLAQKVISEPMRAEAYGFLSAQDVHDIAEAIRQTLHDFNEVHYGHWKDEMVIVFGSALKGLAHSGSDVDMAGSNTVHHGLDAKRFLTGRFFDDVYHDHLWVEGVTNRVAAIIAERHPGLSLVADHVSAHVDNVYTRGSFTAFEPFVIEITPEKATLVVFSHRARVDPQTVNQVTYQNGRWDVPTRRDYVADPVLAIPFTDA